MRSHGIRSDYRRLVHTRVSVVVRAESAKDYHYVATDEAAGQDLSLALRYYPECLFRWSAKLMAWVATYDHCLSRPNVHTLLSSEHRVIGAALY